MIDKSLQIITDIKSSFYKDCIWKRKFVLAIEMKPHVANVLLFRVKCDTKNIVTLQIPVLKDNTMFCKNNQTK